MRESENKKDRLHEKERERAHKASFKLRIAEPIDRFV